MKNIKTNLSDMISMRNPWGLFVLGMIEDSLF